MKKQLIILSALSLLLITSCKKEEEEPPNEDPILGDIRVNGITYGYNDGANYQAGDVISIEVDITDDQDLTKAILKAAFNSAGANDSLITTVSVSGKSVTAKFDYTIPQAMSVGTHTLLSFGTTDEGDGQEWILGYHKITIDPETTPYSIEITGAKTYNAFSTVNTNRVWDVKNDVGIASSSTGSLVYNSFPSSELTNANNPNKFLAYMAYNSLRLVIAPSTFDYATASEATAKPAYDAIIYPANDPWTTEVVVGDVLIGKYQYDSYWGSDRYFVLKITNVVKTTSDNEDYIEFSCKKDLK